MKAGTIATALLLAITAPAVAEDAFPARPITLIVPIAAGGGLDAVARFVARKLCAALDQTIVDRHPAGGSQNIGIRSVRRRRRTDTRCSMPATPSPSIPPCSPISAMTSTTTWTPIGKIASLPLLIVGRAATAYKTLPELIAYAKAHSDKLSYGRPVGHAASSRMELLKSAAAVDITHVPYKGGRRV